ncbi:Hypothetical protein R9X50_00790500 [Acrodontium crateriforme]|uniref:Uncharacterized protein n=1 Tax=Acrodontium crateriforme TaxID=150365 RepID=A0AAQ3MAE5_9PEZI|nr:Hypothetical protein R9X50_00790500 [Acrodontium crateriforme]
MASHESSGGFILSPPASIISTAATANNALPHPRNSPLRAGGSKESAFRRYVDQQILHIQRRFAKRTSPSGNGLSDIDRDKADTWGDVPGYHTMAEACKEIEALVDVIWISGTPSLQVPYLINLAVLQSTIMTAMPPSANRLFRLISKLDHAFASLIQGRDVDTGERLPGFDGMRGLSATEKVRIRSLVERTRVSVVEVFKRGEFEFENEGEETDGGQMETDAEDEGGLILERDGHEEGEEEDSWDMQLARVYDRTIVELGDSLEAPYIGLVTEKRRI